MKMRSRHSRRCTLFERPIVRASTSFNVRLLILPPAHDCKYVNPEDTRAAIKEAIQDAIRDSPCVLISTASGRILHKTEQANSFESLPAFNKLMSSMTKHIDRAQIKQDVAEYYRYGMFSHKWEASEPLFKEVIDKDVYQLQQSPTHDKLKMFCKIVRNDGLNWAWSDTCCINQEDPTVLQEALISMFKWYEGSALTVVLDTFVMSRCDVLSTASGTDVRGHYKNTMPRRWSDSTTGTGRCTKTSTFRITKTRLRSSRRWKEQRVSRRQP